MVMDRLISPNQSPFLKRRILVDGVVVVNEVIDLVKKSKKECLIFKVYFEKEYDLSGLDISRLYACQIRV